MNSYLKLATLAALIAGCSANRYQLTDKGNDKRFLIEIINKEAKAKVISKTPLIVINGIPYRYTHELKESNLPLSKGEIQNIDRIREEDGRKIYGDYAKGGVVLITKKTDLNEKHSTFDESKILFLLGDNEISRDEMELINPDEIQSIDVIKDKEKIKKYTLKDYDGVIIINLKKK